MIEKKFSASRFKSGQVGIGGVVVTEPFVGELCVAFEIKRSPVPIRILVHNETKNPEIDRVSWRVGIGYQRPTGFTADRQTGINQLAVLLERGSVGHFHRF